MECVLVLIAAVTNLVLKQYKILSYSSIDKTFKRDLTFKAKIKVLTELPSFWKL